MTTSIQPSMSCMRILGTRLTNTQHGAQGRLQILSYVRRVSNLKSARLGPQSLVLDCNGMVWWTASSSRCCSPPRPGCAASYPSVRHGPTSYREL
jgi:hypothetical protein